METSFFTGSENLYKYLVSIGLLLIVLTVVYPLKEKQELEVYKIDIQKEALTLNFKIKETIKKINQLKSEVKDGNNVDELNLKLLRVDSLLQQNQISQFELEKKSEEISIRMKHINLYNFLFWVFLPIGVLLTSFGLFKWIKYKSIDDEMLRLEKEKLKLEVDKLREEVSKIMK